MWIQGSPLFALVEGGLRVLHLHHGSTNGVSAAYPPGCLVSKQVSLLYLVSATFYTQDRGFQLSSCVYCMLRFSELASDSKSSESSLDSDDDRDSNGFSSRRRQLPHPRVWSAKNIVELDEFYTRYNTLPKFAFLVLLVLIIATSPTSAYLFN